MKEDKLYAIAMSCARYRDQGCSCQCGVCQFNVFNYVSDVREASLLKANAYTDYQNRQQITVRARDSAFAGFMGPIFAVLIVTGLIIWCASNIKSCIAPPPTLGYTEAPVEWSYEQPAQTAPDRLDELLLYVTMNDATFMRPLGTLEEELIWLSRNQNKVHNIARILLVMRTHGVYDANKDGLIDCIDHSIIFRIMYGSQARLMINNNPQVGMNHMFVRVFYDNTYVDVEPQGEPDRYSMGMVWGTKYNPAFNRDVTAQWGQ